MTAGIPEATLRYSWGAAALIDTSTTIVAAFVGYVIGGITTAAIAFIVLSFLVMALSLRVLSDWNRMAVMRLGRYVGMIGPGLYLIIPFVDSTPITIDVRVISTVLRIERISTKDKVSVDVDAVFSWQIREPEKAILSVHSYYDSILFESQNSMKDVIGNSSLQELLEGKELLGEDIKKLIQERIEGWGIEAMSVEIRDVTIIPGRAAERQTVEPSKATGRGETVMSGGDTGRE